MIRFDFDSFWLDFDSILVGFDSIRLDFGWIRLDFGWIRFGSLGPPRTSEDFLGLPRRS